MVSKQNVFENVFEFFFYSNKFSNFTLVNFSNDYNTFNSNFGLLDVYAICLSVYLHVQLRYFIANYVCKPLSAYLKANPKFVSRTCDSGYKLVIHMTSTLLGIRILFSKDCDVCFNHYNQEFVHDAPIPFDVQVFYIFQMGYYLYGIYSENYLAPKKKAFHSLMMQIHHLFTFILIFGSYITRAHNCGTVIAFLHDINDIFLEMGKLFYALRQQNGKLNPIFNMVVNGCAFLVPFTWIIARLYYFPLVGIQRALEMPPYLYFTILIIFLMAIFMMDIIWAVIMIRFYYKLITGEKREITDPTAPENEKPD